MTVTRFEKGTNLENWIVNVGDGNYSLPPEPEVDINDMCTVDNQSESVLKANVLNRRVMAHNITFKRIVDPAGLTDNHFAKYKFKLPYSISTANTDYNGQTVEGGLFVWDGPDTELDYGLAFQWVINPWDPRYKALLYWNGEGWDEMGVNLEPSDEYCEVEFTLNIPNREAYIKIDNEPFNQNVFSETPKVGWGNTVDARLQTEIISIYPSATGTVPTHEVAFKDWEWEWTTDD
ncbi:hypothetical protein [Saccharicrinis aurantiacus]|uniref:hypothetical protein n=1 Tax=Saccharicrinis aurantiacus TaxID=1849719 RepID=UPI00094F8811|nr:hypothetical protein [Saccharicrinis aurantiacus]